MPARTHWPEKHASMHELRTQAHPHYISQAEVVRRDARAREGGASNLDKLAQHDTQGTATRRNASRKALRE
eukprot:12934025-Alexandrium_andersonii.AAC.1